MLDTAQFASRLRTARERRGLSQQAVADALGLPRTAVTNMESGRRAVSTLELTKLVEADGYTFEFFLAADEGPEEEDLAVMLYRALPEMRHAGEVEKAVWRSLHLCSEGESLRRILGRTVKPGIPDRAMRMTGSSDAFRQGEAAAREERRRLCLGNAPIRNVAEFVSDRGIWAAATELPDSLSGLFVNHSTVGPAILVNWRHPVVRRNLSCAHEYAHILFDRNETVMATWRNNSSELVERRANTFATAFLMPAEGVAEGLERLGKGCPTRRTETIFDVANDSATEVEVRARPGTQTITYHDVAVLARHFAVSFESAVWRLKRLNHIRANGVKALIAQKDIGNDYIKLLEGRKLLGEEKSFERPERELRNQIMHLAIEAFSLEEISGGRLVELSRKLGIQEDKLIGLAEVARSN